MIYIIGMLWLLYSGFCFYILNDTVKNHPKRLQELEDSEFVEEYLKYYLIFNLIAAIIAPVVHLWQVFFWCVSNCYLLLKTVVFGAIDFISNVVKGFKGKK